VYLPCPLPALLVINLGQDFVEVDGGGDAGAGLCPGQQEAGTMRGAVISLLVTAAGAYPHASEWIMP